MAIQSSGHSDSAQGGFTLMEMLIVVGIILLAATMVVWTYSGQVRTQRVRAAASSIVAYLDLAKGEALRQQMFPGLLTNPTQFSGVPATPQYWPFFLKVYKATEDGENLYTISVVALDPASSTESGDLANPVVLPRGIALLKVTGDSTDLPAGDRPVFFRDFSDPDNFAKGDVVGSAKGIIVADALDHSQKVTIWIDPVYGTISTKDETK